MIDRVNMYCVKIMIHHLLRMKQDFQYYLSIDHNVTMILFQLIVMYTMLRLQLESIISLFIMYVLLALKIHYNIMKFTFHHD